MTPSPCWLSFLVVYVALVAPDLPADDAVALAHHLEEQHRFPEATFAYQHALALRPTAALRHATLVCSYNAAVVASSTGDSSKAIQFCLAALKVDAACVEANYQLGLELAQQGRGIEALHYYKQVHLPNPTLLTDNTLLSIQARAMNNAGNVLCGLLSALCSCVPMQV